MKIAIVYNRESQAVINLFGIPNKEKYGMSTIRKVKDALVEHGHQVRLFEGDKNIVANLEKFMPRVLSGERPGLVFNLSYGIQGKGRYMHIPAILEMLGIPYVGSGPETHAIALDKVITKMILMQRGIPTPKFAVLETPESRLDEALQFPLIVKPKNEAVSFGLRIVRTQEELKAGVENIFNEFKSPTLVEEYVDGREFNVALLGNNPVEALPPLEMLFDSGEKIYTYEDKTGKVLKRIQSICPADIDEPLAKKLQDLAIRTFKALGCYDSARVDFRVDDSGNPYVLEVNSMASLGLNSSFVKAASAIGLSYERLIQRIIDVASQRYFGPVIDTGKNGSGEASQAFSFITQNRDRMEGELRSLTNLYTATNDLVAKQTFIRKLEYRLKKMEILKERSRSDDTSHWLFTTNDGLKDGVLLVVPIDIPGHRGAYPIPFRKEPESIFGEGIASSRGGLMVALKTLDALRLLGKLANKKIGVFVYGDEGHGMRYSGPALKEASKQAKEVVVMAPGYNPNSVIYQRRGASKIKVVVEGTPKRIGAKNYTVNALDYLLSKTQELKVLDQKSPLLSVSVQNIETSRYALLVPHRVSATVIVTYTDPQKAKDAEKSIHKLFQSRQRGIKTYFEKLEERPPMLKKEGTKELLKKFEAIAEEWKLPFTSESTLLPSAAGMVDDKTPVICGMAPSTKNLYTPTESINRTELVQKTMLLTQYLLAINED